MKLWFDKQAFDAAVFQRHGTRGHTIITAAVADLTITAANPEILEKIKLNINQIFKMKYLGEFHWLFNLKIKLDIKSNQLVSLNLHILRELLISSI